MKCKIKVDIHSVLKELQAYISAYASVTPGERGNKYFEVASKLGEARAILAVLENEKKKTK